MRPPFFVLSFCLAVILLFTMVFSGPFVTGGASADPGEGDLSTLAANSRLGVDHISAVNQQSYTCGETRYQRASDLGAKWNRWVFYWHEIETSNNNYDYSPQEYVATQDYNHGIQTEGILMGTPGWCTTMSMSAQSNTAPAPRVGQKRFDESGQFLSTQDAPLETFSGPSPATAPPANLYQPVFNSNGSINKNNHWADFVYETVSRFKNRIKVWEIWNEPDFYPNPQHNWFGFWYGSPEQYYQLLKVAYLAAKSADPSCTVIMGGMSYWPDQQQFTGRPNFSFMPRVLDAANADGTAASHNYYFDATAWHWYNRSSQMYYKVNETRQMLANKGFGGKPYWVNECGSPAWDDPAKPPFNGANNKYDCSSTMTEQASYVLQAIAYGLAAGVDKTLIFQQYDDGNAEAFGLLRSNNTMRPQYYAYKLAANYFNNITDITFATQGSAHIVSAYTSDNRRIVAIWNSSPNPMTATVLARGSYGTKITQPTSGDVDGSSQTIYPSNGNYSVYLPGATCRYSNDSGHPFYNDFIIGGMTYMIVENVTGGPTPTPTPAPISTGLITNGDFERSNAFEGWYTGGSTNPQTTTDAYRGGRAAILGKDFVGQPDLGGGGNSTIS